MGSYLQTLATKVGLSEAKGGSLGAAVTGTFRFPGRMEAPLHPFTHPKTKWPEGRVMNLASNLKASA